MHEQAESDMARFQLQRYKHHCVASCHLLPWPAMTSRMLACHGQPLAEGRFSCGKMLRAMFWCGQAKASLSPAQLLLIQILAHASSLQAAHNMHPASDSITLSKNGPRSINRRCRVISSAS